MICTLIIATGLLFMPAKTTAAMEPEEIMARLATGQPVPGYERWERRREVKRKAGAHIIQAAHARQGGCVRLVLGAKARRSSVRN